MDRFLREVRADTLAVIVLAVLIIIGITSLVLLLRPTPVSTNKSWYVRLLPLFAILGLPAVIDLLQTDGITKVFAFLVLVVLLLNIIMPLLHLINKSPSVFVSNWHTWSVPVLIAGGLVVAGYLTYVEITAATPVCGITIPGCVVVQTSPYARLFGFLPIGVLGLVGYVAILAAWLLAQFGAESYKKASSLAIWGLCFFGVIFSAYLTYLEPFVIRATCSWCITSAVFMILLLWVSIPAAQDFFIESQDED